MAGPYEPLTAPVAATIARYGLLDAGCRVLAAVSGGPDSTALALLLHGLGYDVVVGHVDHGTRPGSEQDAARCRELADRLGVPFDAVRLPSPPGGEAEARTARYAALAAMARRCGASRTATGHTLDDAAETVALRLGRGGRAIGIPPRRGEVVRPLLGLRRADTEAVCRRADVAWAEDPTNRDLRHRRNRLRRSALPALGGAEVRRLGALGTAEAVAAQQRREAREALTAGLLTCLPTRDGPRVELDRNAVAALPAAAAHEVVRTALERLGLDPGAALVRDVTARVPAVTGAGIDLPGGLRAWSDAGRVVLGSPRPPVVLPDVTLAVPGVTACPGWGLTACVEEADPRGPFPAADAPEAVVDADAAGGGLVLRARRPGDRFEPLGAPGTTSLKDLFVDRKIPREDRPRVPVVAAAGGILWVAGVRIAHGARVHADTSRAIRIRLVGLVGEAS
jgi:tRNA(Ile)-lysidine synthase